MSRVVLSIRTPDLKKIEKGEPAESSTRVDRECADLGQSCPKPWDYCCETPESLKSNSVTVQIVDASNETVRVDLSRHGFKPLDEVVVVGTVGPRPNPEVFVIKAEKIHRVSG